MRQVLAQEIGAWRPISTRLKAAGGTPVNRRPPSARW